MERTVNERKEQRLSILRNRKSGNKGVGGMIACAALKHTCCVVAATYAQLSNDKTRWKHSCPPSHPTYHTVTVVLTQAWHIPPHKSIHQAVVMIMSEVTAGELDDRCVWQMVPSARASRRHRTSSLSFALTSLTLLIILHFLSCVSTDCHGATWTGYISKVPVL